MLEFDQYAPFIWASYGLSALVLGALVVQTFRGRR
ncbi:heme exporter protein CcmD [Fretibacter rubidus]